MHLQADMCLPWLQLIDKLELTDQGLQVTLTMKRPVSDIEALSVWSDIALLLMAVATVDCIALSALTQVLLKHCFGIASLSDDASKLKAEVKFDAA